VCVNVGVVYALVSMYVHVCEKNTSTQKTRQTQNTNTSVKYTRKHTNWEREEKKASVCEAKRESERRT